MAKKELEIVTCRLTRKTLCKLLLGKKLKIMNIVKCKDKIINLIIEVADEK